MTIIVDEKPSEQSSLLINVLFDDANGTEVDLSAATSKVYELSDADGTVVNNLSFGSKEIPVDGNIFLYGDDLQLLEGETCAQRRLAVKVVYDVTIGAVEYTNVTYTNEYGFCIDDVVAIPAGPIVSESLEMAGDLEMGGDLEMK